MKIDETATISLSTLIGLFLFQIIEYRGLYPPLGLLVVAGCCKSALGAKHKQIPFQDTDDYSKLDMFYFHVLNICLGMTMAYVLFLVFPRT